MKMIHCLFFVSILVSMPSFSQIKTLSLKVPISEAKDRAVAECGVKLYKKKDNHPSCGIHSYKSGTGPACGVARYISRRHRLCGVDTYKEGTGGPCGYNNIVKKKCLVRNPFTGKCSVFGDEVIDRRGKVCRHKNFGVERYKLCSRAEFGVRAYKTCSNPAFGTNYKSCRLPEFGVESYNTCKIRKTATELEVYLASTEPYIEVNAINMAKAQTSFLFKSGQQKQTSCLIERWEDDPLYFDVVEDMKNTYAVSFGEDYEFGKFDCENPDLVPNLSFEGQNCSDLTASDVSERLKDIMISSGEKYFLNTCQEKKLYETYRSWFVDNITEVNNLLVDVVALADANYKARLKKLLSSLSGVKIDEISDSMNIQMDAMGNEEEMEDTENGMDTDVMDIPSMLDLGNEMSYNTSNPMSNDMLKMLQERAIPVTMTCKWASRPFAYQLEDAVAFVNSRKNNVNIFSYAKVADKGCETVDMNDTELLKSLKDSSHVRKLADFGYQKDMRKTLSGENDPFWEMVRKYSRRITQSCSWASRPRIYQFQDFIVYLDSRRTSFNIFSNKTVRNHNCEIPELN